MWGCENCCVFWTVLGLSFFFFLIFADCLETSQVGWEVWCSGSCFCSSLTCIQPVFLPAFSILFFFSSYISKERKLILVWLDSKPPWLLLFLLWTLLLSLFLTFSPSGTLNSYHAKANVLRLTSLGMKTLGIDKCLNSLAFIFDCSSLKYHRSKLHICQALGWLTLCTFELALWEKYKVVVRKEVNYCTNFWQNYTLT